MSSRALSSLVLLGSVTLLFSSGCLAPAPPENAVTWGLKAATGQLTQTTPREWQALATKVNELAPQADLPPLTDEQAQAIVDFVQANELDSVEDITNLVTEAQADPAVLETVEIPESVIVLFSDVDFDSISEEIIGEETGV